MTDYQRGDRVTITHPLPPTSLQPGDTAVVLDTWAGVIQIQDGRGGAPQTVHPHEISKG